MEFGWDKKTVDSQSLNYMKNLLVYHKKVNDKVFNAPALPSASKFAKQIRNFK